MHEKNVWLPWKNGWSQYTKMDSMLCSSERVEGHTYTTRQIADAINLVNKTVASKYPMQSGDLNKLRPCYDVLTSQQLWDLRTVVTRGIEGKPLAFAVIDGLQGGFTVHDFRNVGYFLDRWLQLTDLRIWEVGKGSRHTHGVSYCLSQYGNIEDRTFFIKLLRCYVLAYPRSVNVSFPDHRFGLDSFPLHSAVQFDDVAPMRTLLEAGASVCLEDEIGRTAPFLLASLGLDDTGNLQRHLEAKIKMLHDHGMDITQISGDLTNLFHHAVRFTNPKMLQSILDIRQELLVDGAWVGDADPINQVDKDFCTPLLAVFTAGVLYSDDESPPESDKVSKSDILIKMLLDAGANANEVSTGDKDVGKICMLYDEKYTHPANMVTVTIRKDTCSLKIVTHGDQFATMVCPVLSHLPKIFGVTKSQVFKKLRQGHMFTSDESLPDNEFSIAYTVCKDGFCVPSLEHNADYKSVICPVKLPSPWAKKEFYSHNHFSPDYWVSVVQNPHSVALHHLAIRGVHAALTGPHLRLTHRLCDPLLYAAVGDEAETTDILTRKRADHRLKHRDDSESELWHK